jgi:hypothetical protein
MNDGIFEHFWLSVMLILFQKSSQNRFAYELSAIGEGVSMTEHLK